MAPRTTLAQARAHKRTRSAHSREIAQDYLEAVAGLIEQRGEARVVDLARCLGVTHVTVTKTLARLRRDGLVNAEPYRAVFLTAAGRKVASASRRRHAVVVAFLRALGVPARAAEEDAEGIEHHVSRATLAAMARHLARAGARESAGVDTPPRRSSRARTGVQGIGGARGRSATAAAVDGGRRKDVV